MVFAIVSARGALFATSSDTYCSATVVGKPAELRTNVVRSTHAPAWRHHGCLPFSTGDDLDFTIWSRDASGADTALAKALLPSWDVDVGERRIALRVDGHSKGELLVRVISVPGVPTNMHEFGPPPSLPGGSPHIDGKLWGPAPTQQTAAGVMFEERPAEERRRRVEEKLRRMEAEGLLRPSPRHEAMRHSRQADLVPAQATEAPLKVFGPLPQRAESTAPLRRRKDLSPKARSTTQRHVDCPRAQDSMYDDCVEPVLDEQMDGACPLKMFGSLPYSEEVPGWMHAVAEGPACKIIGDVGSPFWTQGLID